MSIVDILEASDDAQSEIVEMPEKIATADALKATITTTSIATSKVKQPSKKEKSAPKKEKATPKKLATKKDKAKVSREVAAFVIPKEAESTTLATKEPEIAPIFLVFKEPATTPLTKEKTSSTSIVTQNPATIPPLTKEADIKPYEPSFLDTFEVEELLVVEPKPEETVSRENHSEVESSKADSRTGKKRGRPSIKATGDTKIEASDLPKVKKPRGRPKASADNSLSKKKVVLENGVKRGRGRPFGTGNSAKKEIKVVLEGGVKRGRGRPKGSFKGSVKEKSEGEAFSPNVQSRGRGRPRSNSKLLREDGTDIGGKSSYHKKYKGIFDNVVYEPHRDNNRCLTGRLRSSFLPIKELELSAESMINFPKWASKYYESLEKKQQNFDEDIKLLIEMETIKYARNEVSLWDSDLISLDKTLFESDTDSKLDFSSGLSRMDLRLILDWKFLREKKVRGIYKLLNSNSEAAVKKAIKIVYNSLKEKLVLSQEKGPAQFLADFKSDIGSWMIHLTGLNGITVPTASAILATMTAYVPYMSHEGLSASKGQSCNRIALDSYNSYIDYVYSIMKKSDSVGLTPRIIERAWYAKAVLSDTSE